MSLSRETRRRLEYAFGYIGLGMFEAARLELDAIAEEDQMRPEVRSPRVDLHMGAKQWENAFVVASELARAPGSGERVDRMGVCAARAGPRGGGARGAARSGGAPRRGERGVALQSRVLDSLLGALKNAKSRLARACRMDAQFKAAARDDPDLQALRAANV